MPFFNFPLSGINTTSTTLKTEEKTPWYEIAGGIAGSLASIFGGKEKTPSYQPVPTYQAPQITPGIPWIPIFLGLAGLGVMIVLMKK